MVKLPRYPLVVLGVASLTVAPLSISALVQTPVDPRLAWRIPTEGEHHIFGRIVDVAQGPDGLVYVADALESMVYAFTTNGELVRRIGRRGMGPGEFRSLTGITWVGDTLSVVDNGNMRVSFFDLSGDLILDFPIAPITDSAGYPSIPFRALPNGRVLAVPQLSMALFMSGQDLSNVPLMIGRREGGRGAPGPSVDLRRYGMVVFVDETPILISNQDLVQALVGGIPWTVAANGDGVVTMRRDRSRRFAIVFHSFAGGMNTLSGPLVNTGTAPRSVLDSLIATEVERGSRRLPERALRNALERLLNRSTEMPLARRILHGSDGSVWVEPPRWARDPSWMVIDPAAQTYRTVILPPVLRPEVVGLDWVIGVEWNTDDEQSVVQYELPRGQRMR